MADSTTPNLGLVKPEINASDDTWGEKTNTNWDKVDSLVATKAELNAAIAGAVFPAGTRLLFQQSAAPTGWTKDTTHNDKALRIVSGNVEVGGSLAFTAAFSARNIDGSTNEVATTGTVGDTALTEAQMPAHVHLNVAAANSSAALTETNQITRNYDGTTNLDYALKGSATAATVGKSSSVGGGEAHSHSFTGSSHSHTLSGSLDMAVAYVDVIIAVKD